MTADSLPSNRVTGAFERRVAGALAPLAPPDVPLVVACSGGPDSTATLVAVSRARPQSKVVAACFDHGLRPTEETTAEQAAVDAVAQSLGREALHGAAAGAADGAAGSEEAARRARYRWLAGACAQAGAAHCVTGHTLDDQAETVLLRLARGAGTAGAAAMAADAPWPVDCPGAALRVLRPLLGVRRAEALAYLAALELEPRSDPTNELVTFDRNRVRHRILPELRAINPRADEALARFAALAGRDDDALRMWAEHEAQSIVRPCPDGVEVSRRPLLKLPPAVASRILRRAAEAGGIALEAGQVDQLLRIVARRGARLSLAGGEAAVDGDVLRITRGRRVHRRRIERGRAAGRAGRFRT